MPLYKVFNGATRLPLETARKTMGGEARKREREEELKPEKREKVNTARLTPKPKAEGVADLRDELLNELWKERHELLEERDDLLEEREKLGAQCDELLGLVKNAHERLAERERKETENQAKAYPFWRRHPGFWPW